MADLQVTVGADLSQYNAALNQAAQTANQAASSIGGALDNATHQTNALGNSAMSASMRMMQMRSGLSAARDGVVGFAIGGQSGDRMLMAMGHHINSLINETGSFTGAMGAMGAALMGPGGVILAITAAVEIYKHFVEASKAATETQTDFQKSVESSAKGSGDELAHLSLLYAATQDDTLSRQARLKAVKELQDEYPSYFGNMDKEAILAGKAAGAYDSLTQSIINTAIVKAGQDQLGGQFKELIQLQTLAKETQLKLDEANKAAALHPDNKKMFSNVTTSSTGFRDVGANASSAKPVVGSSFVYDKEKNDLKSLDEYRDALKEKIKATQQAVSDMVSQFGINTLLEKPEAKDKHHVKTQAEKDREAALKVQKEYDNKELESSLVTEAKEIQIANDKFNKELAIEKKGGADTTSLVNYHNGQIEAIHKKYADKRAEITKSIEDEIAGIGENSRDKELAANQSWYDLKLKQIKDFGADYIAEKIKLDNALAGKNKATNLKFDDKEFGASMDEKKKSFDSGEKDSIKLFDSKKAQKDLDNWFSSEKKKIISGGKDIQAQLSKLFDDYTKKVTSNKAEEESINRRVSTAGMLSDAFSQAFNSIITGSQSASQAIVGALEQMIVKMVEAIAEAVILAGVMSAMGLGSFSGLLMGSAGQTGLMSRATGGIIGHASGGITLKPHMAMVGEGGESEVIAPLSKLKGMMGGGNGSMTHNVVVTGKLSGNDIRISQVRTNASNSRRT